MYLNCILTFKQYLKCIFMKLTVFTDYSLRVLLMLAVKRSELLTIAQVAAYFQISQAHLMKVTHALGRSGWVETVRGRNGGMRLSIDPEKLRLDQIVSYLEGNFEAAECFTKTNTCQLSGACGLESALRQAELALTASLAQHTLASISRNTVLGPPALAVVAAPVSLKHPRRVDAVPA